MTGKYTISVTGNGTFNSGNSIGDADALAKTFVEVLQANGQSVSEAKFCFASVETCRDLVTGQTLPSTGQTVT